MTPVHQASSPPRNGTRPGPSLPVKRVFRRQSDFLNNQCYWHKKKSFQQMLRISQRLDTTTPPRIKKLQLGNNHETKSTDKKDSEEPVICKLVRRVSPATNLAGGALVGLSA